MWPTLVCRFWSNEHKWWGDFRFKFQGWSIIIFYAIDTGISVTVQRPSIWTIDLKTDKILNRYEIPETVARDGGGFASLTVDVIDCQNNNTFVYVPDLLHSLILVYSYSTNTSYNVQHNFFHMHPFQGEYDVDDLKFSWDDAIFSIALSERDQNSSHRLAYFHPMSR